MWQKTETFQARSPDGRAFSVSKLNLFWNRRLVRAPARYLLDGITPLSALNDGTLALPGTGLVLRR